MESGFLHRGIFKYLVKALQPSGRLGDLEHRLQVVESKLAVVQAQTNYLASHCIIFIPPSPLDTYEEDIRRLEKVFNSLSENFLRVSWCKDINDDRTECFRLAC